MRRQHLDERVPRDRWLDVVKDHVAIQAQVMSAAELTLDARVEDLGRDDIRDALWTHRTLVKTWAMRGTLHLVAADELPDLVGALANRESWRSEAWLRYFGVSEAQMDAWVADLDSWDVCDAVCGNLFDRTTFALDKAVEWSTRDAKVLGHRVEIVTFRRFIVRLAR